MMRSPRVWTATALVLSMAAVAVARSEVVVVSHGLPGELEAATRLTVPVELENHGSTSWDPAAGFAASYHWIDDAGAVVVWDGLRTALPSVVAPGERVDLDAVVEVPRTEGELRLQWDIVWEGHIWLAERTGSTPLDIPVTVRPGYAFTVVSGSPPWWSLAGRATIRRLVVRNDGTRAWPPDGSVALSYHWLDPDGQAVVWDGERTPLPVAVEPGGEVVLEARLVPPETPGRFGLQWDMVCEGVAWFSQRDPTPEPLRAVRVFVPPWSSLGSWALVSLILAVSAVVVVRRGRPGVLLGAAALADVIWCAGAIAVKQQVVLAQAGQPGGVRSVLISLAGVSLLLLPALMLPRRVRAWGCWALAALATMLLFADLVYERFFGDLLSVAVMGAAGQLADVRASVASLLAPSDAWFWLDLLAGAAVALAVARVPQRVGGRATAVAAAALGVTLLAGALSAAAVVRSGAVSLGQVFRNVAVAREVGVLNFHALDAGRALVARVRRPALEPAEIDRLTAWFADRAPLRAGTGSWFGAAEGNNLLMVQAESLQGFVLGLEVAGQEVTPFLNRWAAQAMLFANATDQTGQGRSSDAELLTQVSLLPPALGTAAFLYPSHRDTGIAAVLADRGYRTISAVAYDGSFWNRRLTHPAYGFAESRFADAFEEGEVLGWGLNDRDFFRQMVGALAAGRQPFCALLLTLSLHHPFEGFPDRLKELEIGELEGTPLGNYLHTMRFFDHAFADLMAELEVTGLADRTVVVLWGDHDAGLEWTPQLASMTGQRHDDAGWYLSQRVPLLIRAPQALGLVGRSDVPAGHQDVAPTVLALLGVDPAPFAFIGRNLLGHPGGGPVVGEYHCWQDDAHLFLQGPTGRLEDGRCFELPELRVAPATACAAGASAARQQIDASRRILGYDLQEEIHDRLAARVGSGP